MKIKNYQVLNSVQDKLMVTELNEESVLRILASLKKPLELLPVYKDENIPLKQIAEFNRLILVLQDKKKEDGDL